MDGLLWSTRFDTVRMSTPLLSSTEACRKLWNVAFTFALRAQSRLTLSHDPKHSRRQVNHSDYTRHPTALYAKKQSKVMRIAEPSYSTRRGEGRRR